MSRVLEVRGISRETALKAVKGVVGGMFDDAVSAFVFSCKL